MQSIPRQSWVPRFSIRSVLLVTAIIAAWSTWIRWPSISARRFVADPNAFTAHLDQADESVAAFAEYLAREGQQTTTPHERSWSELLHGRQTFTCGTYEFSICRGELQHPPEYFFQSMFRYNR